MKNYFLYAIMLFSLSVSAQKIVTQGVLGKDKPLFSYNFLPKTNTIVIAEAYGKSPIVGKYDNAIRFDETGKNQILNDGVKFNKLKFSWDESVFKTIFQEVSVMGAGPVKINFFSAGKVYEYPVRKYCKCHEQFDKLLDNQYQLRVTNYEQNDNEPNFEEDLLYLQKYDYKKAANQSVKIAKPDIARLRTADLLKVKKIGFRTDMTAENTFEIITKSIGKDEKSATIYRTIYNPEGKIINDYAYAYSIPNGKLLGCNTRDELYDSVSEFSKAYTDGPIADLGINEHYIDPVNGEVYIYGIYGERNPAGYYIIKFSQDGKKIWETFENIEDKDFTRGQLWYKAIFRLHEFQNNAFAVLLDGYGYNLFYVINKNDGKIEKRASSESDSDTFKGTMAATTRYSIYENAKLSKNRYCDNETLMAYAVDRKIKSYIDAISQKKDIFFNTRFNKNGTWLIETDNEAYYKVTYFE